MSGNKIYDTFMNLATEIGELEIENKDLRNSIKNLNFAIDALNKKLGETKGKLVEVTDKKEEYARDLLVFETATFWDRLKYLIRGRI